MPSGKPETPEMRLVEVEIRGLGTDESSSATVLVLGHEEAVLPMVIGLAEAASISKALGQTDLPRPVAHDLMVELLEISDGELRQVEVLDLRDGTYFAVLVVALADGSVERVDSRPSDAIALALRIGAPVLVSEHLLWEDANDAQGFPDPTDKKGWKKVLEEMRPEDFKYKM